MGDLQIRFAGRAGIVIGGRQAEASVETTVAEVGEGVPENAARVAIDVGGFADDGRRLPGGAAVGRVFACQRQQVGFGIGEFEGDLDHAPHRIGRSGELSDRGQVVVDAEIGGDRLLAGRVVGVADGDDEADDFVLLGEVDIGVPDRRQGHTLVLGGIQLGADAGDGGRPPGAAQFVGEADGDGAVVVVGDGEVDADLAGLFSCGRDDGGYGHAEFHSFTGEGDVGFAPIRVVGADVQIAGDRPFLGRLEGDGDGLLAARRYVEGGRRNGKWRLGGDFEHAQGVDALVGDDERPLADAADAHGAEVVIVGRRGEDHLRLLGHGLAGQLDLQARIFDVVGADGQVLGEGPFLRGEEGDGHSLAASGRQLERLDGGGKRFGYLDGAHFERVLGTGAVADGEGPLDAGVDLEGAEVMWADVVDDHFGLFGRWGIDGELDGARPAPQAVLVLHADGDGVRADAQIGALDLAGDFFEATAPVAVGRLHGGGVALARVAVDEIFGGDDLELGVAGVFDRFADIEELAARAAPVAVDVLEAGVDDVAADVQALDGDVDGAGLGVAVEGAVFGL